MINNILNIAAQTGSAEHFSDWHGMSPQSQPSSRHQHFAALDGLRGISAASVLAVHAMDPFDLTHLLPHSGLAVDFFFMLSGFVLCYAYERRLLTGMSLREFARTRLIRLYPLYIFGLLFGFAVFAAKTYVEHQALNLDELLALLLGVVILPTSLIHSNGWDAVFPYNIPSWTLFFQLSVNLIYALIVFRLSQRLLLAILMLSGAVVVLQAYHLGGVYGGDHWIDFPYGFGRVVFPFFCGIFLFRWQRSRADAGLSLPTWLPVPVLLLIFAASLAYPVAQFNWLFEAVMIMLVFPALVICGIQSRPSPQSKAVYLFLGKISYPVYITHYPIIRLFSHFARSLSVTGYGVWLVIGAEMSCSVIFAVVVMKAFDEPLRAWLSARSRPVAPANTAAGIG